MWARISGVLDASFFFRAVAAVLNFLRDVCRDSFLVGLFTADYDPERLEHARFTRILYGLLNLFPKRVPRPPLWPRALSRFASGSFLIRTLCDQLDMPVPPPGAYKPVPPVLQWCLHAAPAAGLLAVAVLAPFLPTMALAGLCVGVILLTWVTRRFFPDITALVVLLFILVTVFTAVTSFVPESSLPIAMLTSAFMFTAVLTPALCPRIKPVGFFLWALVTSAAAVGLVGLYQFFLREVDTTWVDVAMFGDIEFRVHATFGNPNVYGSYLLLVLPLCAGLFFYAEKPGLKLYALGVFALLAANLLLTASRGCWLAVCVSALVFVLLTEKRLAALVPPGLLGLFFVLPPSFANRILSIFTLGGGVTMDTSTEFRMYIWQGTLRMLTDFWPMGIGQGRAAYNAVYPVYGFNDVVAPHAHNIFLQVFTETGIVGLLAFVAIIACFIREMAGCLRRCRKDRTRYIPAAMIAAMVGFFIMGMFDHVFYNYRVMLTFFVFVGLGAAYSRATRPQAAALSE